MEPHVVHNSSKHRYEIFIGDEKVGHADYSLMLNEIHFVHVEVDPAHQGKNLAAILMREALADVRNQGNLKAWPICSYAVRYMERHPETQDLLPRPIEEAAAACQIPRPEKWAAKHGIELNKPAG